MASSTSLSVSCAGRNGVRRKDAMIRETKTNNLDFIAGKLTPCLRAAIDNVTRDSCLINYPLRGPSSSARFAMTGGCLFDAIPAMAQKGEHAADAAHMSRTGDNEVGLSLRRYPFVFGIRHRCPGLSKQRQPHSTFACIRMA